MTITLAEAACFMERLCYTLLVDIVVYLNFDIAVYTPTLEHGSWHYFLNVVNLGHLLYHFL